MRNSEQLPRGRQILGITALPPPVREKELAPPPTPEEVKAANAGEFAGETRTVKRVGGNKGLKILGAVGVTAGAGVGAYEAYQNIPAVHQAVDSAFLDHIKGNSSTLKDSFFDNSATKGVVGPNTILYIPKEEFNKLPTADEKGNPIFDFPWDKNHPVEIKYKTDAIGDSAIAEAKANGMPNAEDYKGYKPQINSENPLPVGYEFSTIYPGGRIFFSADPYNKDIIVMAKIEFIAPNGILYFVNIQIIDDSGGIEKNLPILPLIDAPLIGDDNRQGKDWEKGTLASESLTKIFRVLKEGKLKMMTSGGKNGSLLLPKDRVPGDFKFKTGTDASGTTKILVTDSR